MPNTNGLTTNGDTFLTGDPESYIYVRRGRNGDSVIDGDLTVEGNMFVQGGSTLPVINAPDVSGNALYFKNPYNLGGSTDISNSVAIFEGGALRSDISQSQVTMSLYKPITRGIVDNGTGEQLSSLSSWGNDTSDNVVKYTDIRSVITSPLSTNKRARINFGVQQNGASPTSIFQIDGSQNLVQTLSGAAFTADGAISGASSVTAATDLVGRGATIKEVTGQLGGIEIQVDNVVLGRVNHDATNMIVRGLGGTPSSVSLQCDGIRAVNAIKDASNNVVVKLGSSSSPDVFFEKVNASGTFPYIPALLKTTAAYVPGQGSVVSFTNVAQVMSASAMTAPYQGYYQFMAQFTTTSVGTFDPVTDEIIFYADISGGSLTPLVGSIYYIDGVGTGSAFAKTFGGYVFLEAGDTVRLIHVDSGTFTITDGVLFNMWNYLGAGLGLP
jgi:hypothetical protein